MLFVNALPHRLPAIGLGSEEIKQNMTTDNLPPFEEFQKIARLSRGCVVTEKIDGTNAQIMITEEGGFHVGSRNRWLTLENDNFGFCRWANDNKEELLKLGLGRHYGEWWGSGIQRGYGLNEKRFSLFNTARWEFNPKPACVHLVPVLYTGFFDISEIEGALERLKQEGSVASPGFMKPEGVIVYHVASRTLFKKTIEKDDEPKSKQSATA